MKGQIDKLNKGLDFLELDSISIIYAPKIIPKKYKEDRDELKLVYYRKTGEIKFFSSLISYHNGDFYDNYSANIPETSFEEVIPRFLKRVDTKISEKIRLQLDKEAKARELNEISKRRQELGI